MINTKGRRARNRRKLARSIRRTAKNVLLMPGRIPPITVDTVEIAMKICEVFGVLFVASLVGKLATDNTIVSVINLITGIIFFGFIAFIKLADYQDRLIKEQLSNYIYLR